jgi:hypothetical protein
MKAIHINLDPYLAAFAAWLKGGKSGDAPSFDPLPLAVTIPLGESAAIYCPGNTDGEGAHFRVDGKSVYAFATGQFDPSGEGPFVATNVSPGLSIYPATESMGQKYAIAAVASDTLEISIRVQDMNEDGITIPFTVLVRRETASGPVDLVDFTPPASAIAPAGD